MITLAHLSDVHLLARAHATSALRTRAAVRYLSLGRTVDPEDRRARFVAALATAAAMHPDFTVLTGDLTETGTVEQFEHVAELLHESRLPADRLMLVPGNHDLYDHPDAWSRALAGPLRPWAATSEPGTVMDLPGIRLLAVSTARHQSVLRSAGALSHQALQVLRDRLSTPRDHGQPLVLVQHHPPVRHPVPGMHWLDGLQNHRTMLFMVAAHPDVHVLHGHTHQQSDRAHHGTGRTRLFSAPAVVDGRHPVRRYTVTGGALRPVHAPGHDGRVPLAASPMHGMGATVSPMAT